MSSELHPDLHPEGSDAVAMTVREELARRRLSRQWLADSARISLSTLEKALSGRRPFTLATVVRMEEALGIPLRNGALARPAEPAAASGFAPEEMGAYARPAVRWLEGEYLTVRPSFSEPGALYAYRTLIAWDEAKGHLAFSETNRLDQDFEQKGFVSFPHLSGHIYLVTGSAGQYRVAILNRPSGGGALNGVLATLVAGAGAQLIPAAAPIALVPAARTADPEYGVIRPGTRCFEEFRGCVDRITERDYALFPR
ncbi:MAG: helix-turn-helix transcriptional regulator [Alphaproteobacteria bacterium]|nr:helix-turn-helix transcriptional regulator [Alphaproteobacteria bacterium]